MYLSLTAWPYTATHALWIPLISRWGWKFWQSSLMRLKLRWWNWTAAWMEEWVSISQNHFSRCCTVCHVLARLPGWGPIVMLPCDTGTQVWYHSRSVTLSLPRFHAVTLLFFRLYHTLTLSFCRVVSPSHCHTTTLWPCRTVAHLFISLCVCLRLYFRALRNSSAMWKLLLRSVTLCLKKETRKKRSKKHTHTCQKLCTSALNQLYTTQSVSRVCVTVRISPYINTLWCVCLPYIKFKSILFI